MPIIVLFTNFCDAATSPCNATTTKPHVSTEQNWCPWRESDPRPLPYQGSALPLSHMGMSCHTCYWSGRRGSNSRHLAWKASALPTELHPHYAEHPRKVLTDPLYSNTYRQSFLVEGAGFEPAYSERTDLQSVAFNHSATPPKSTAIIAANPTSVNANCI